MHTACFLRLWSPLTSVQLPVRVVIKLSDVGVKLGEEVIQASHSSGTAPCRRLFVELDPNRSRTQPGLCFIEPMRRHRRG